MEERDGINAITETIIGCAMRVHSALGPGLLESAYETCLVHELVKAQIKVDRQVPLPIQYDGLNLDAGYRLDLLVDRRVVVELKTVDRLEPIHTAQLLSYLKLGNLTLGLLINFNVVHLRNGINRLLKKSKMYSHSSFPRKRESSNCLIWLRHKLLDPRFRGGDRSFSATC